MKIDTLEKYNQTKLSKKYHETAKNMSIDLFNDIVKSWKTGNNKLYCDTLKRCKGRPSHEYYILAIWLHPLTKFKQLAVKIDKLQKGGGE